MAYIISLLITGLVVGALGRLVIPGKNQMSILATIAVGIGGAFLGGIVGSLLFSGPTAGLLLAVLGAAFIVWLIERSRAPQAG
jgi:uncharacterized membrane protein YeaQ/YmgE (transglycosylase-associated protein family)